MNKLRLIRIYELRGKVHPIEAFIIDLLDGIEIKSTNRNSVYYIKNNNVYFTYCLSYKRITTYPMLVKIFMNANKCSYAEKTIIIKYLLEKHLKTTIDIVW